MWVMFRHSLQSNQTNWAGLSPICANALSLSERARQAKAAPAVLLLKSYEPVTEYSGAFSEEALTQWALANCEPVLTEMDQCAPVHTKSCNKKPQVMWPMT